MDVKAAVDLAKATVADLFAPEGVVNLGLEEVEHDDVQDLWRITVGFSRCWDQQGVAGMILVAPRRTYKVVIINKAGLAVAVKNRDMADSA
jgi:hypothetical protein